MKELTNEVVEKLFEKTDDNLVSIYLPTHRRSSPPNMQEDQTRFKNLVRQAAEQMAEIGADESEVEGFKSQLLKYLDNREFWQGLTESLAIFANKDEASMYCLPVEVDELVYVGSKFDVTPLLIIQEMNRPFYVLALAMHNPILFKGDMSGLHDTNIELPKSLEEALNIDEMFINSNTVRGHEGTGGLSHAIGPHGQGDSAEAGREERFQFFRIIEHEIRESNNFDLTAPFVVAATDSEAGDFMAHTSMPSMVDKFIPGNYTKTDLSVLHAQALAVVRDQVLAKDMSDLVERFQEQKGIDKSSSDSSAIEEAAKAGRVDTLLVDIFDMTTDSVRDIEHAILKLRYRRDQNLKRLLDVIRAVIENGGRVVGLRSQSMPDGVQLAALYRY